MASFYAAARTLLLLFLPQLAAAQWTPQTNLQVKSADGTPLAVAVGEIRYGQTGRQVWVDNVPAGERQLRVYALGAKSKHGGARETLVYQRYIDIRPGTKVECLVDVVRKTARVRTVIPTPPAATPRDFKVTAPPVSANAYKYSHGSSGYLTLSDLQAQVLQRNDDWNKLEVIKRGVNYRTLSTGEIRTIAGWLSSESKRLEFLEWAYPHAEDRSNFLRLEDALSSQTTKQELENFISNSR